ncbi:MAG: substrate-binding domain-containing protein [Alphaproteobacteria bacterium]|nr:substrate-binding domain-containing protein [Alphaproteobacteria bacterium]
MQAGRLCEGRTVRHASGTGAWRHLIWVGIALLVASPASAQAPMKIVGSTFLAPFVESATGRLVSASVIVAPQQEYRGTVNGIKAFCRSAAPDSPSVVAMSRRMRGEEFEECRQRGVGEIIEIQIGYSALVLAAPRGDPDYGLKLLDLYRAMARDIPHDDEFLANRFMRWRDIDQDLPDLPIRVVMPAPGLGSRGFFEDRFLQGACRLIPEIRTIFTAESRVNQCVALRSDGRIVEVGYPFEASARQALTDAPAGTVAILPSNIAQKMSDIVKTLPLDGAQASQATVATREYPYVRPLFVYVKRRHVKDYKGVGPVAGLRELITELTRERAIGPDGYMISEGLVALDDSRRESMRHHALTLTPMER